MRRLIHLLFVCIAICVVTSVSAQEITKKRGKVKFYHSNGKVSSKGKVKNYKRQGEWNYYAEEGYLFRRAYFINDTINGDYREYSRTSFISVQGTYCMNQKCGNWKTYDSQAHLISDENFNADVSDGIQRYWFPGGHLRDSIVFHKGIIEYRKIWYASGGVKAIEIYVNGLAEGRWTVYPEVRVDTFASTVDDYHLGKRHGWHYMWNGSSLIHAFQYQNGLPDGTFTRYSFDGKPLVIQNYSQGKLNGKTTFFKDGLKLKEENYLDDLKEGEQLEYDRNEKVSIRSWYRHGDIDSSYSYHSNGRVAIRRVYGGMLGFSPYKEWDSTGVQIMTGMMYGELRDGEWTTYYPNGKVRSTTNYQQGKIIGLYTKYYPNGKKMIQYTFLPIGTNTMPDVWNEKGKILRMGTKEYEEIVEGNRPGEILSDPSEYRRSIIDHRLNERAFYHGEEITEGEALRLEVDDAMAIEEYEQTQNENDSGEVYSFCEVMPMFPGGSDSMQAYFRRNATYPADDHAKYGTVYVNFVVEKDGRITNVRVVKGVTGAPELDREATRMVSSFPLWNPALMSGQSVRCNFTIPIRFEPNR